MRQWIAERKGLRLVLGTLACAAGIGGGVKAAVTYDRSTHPPPLAQLVDERWQVGGYDARAYCRPAGSIRLAVESRSVYDCANAANGPVAANQGFFVDLNGRVVDVTARLTGHG